MEGGVQRSQENRCRAVLRAEHRRNRTGEGGCWEPTPPQPQTLMLWGLPQGTVQRADGARSWGGTGEALEADPAHPPISPRPCAMVVPDFELICEIMLVAEGFLEARLLARKFITLYTLCRELLSKQVCAGAHRVEGEWGRASSRPAWGRF